MAPIRLNRIVRPPTISPIPNIPIVQIIIAMIPTMVTANLVSKKTRDIRRSTEITISSIKMEETSSAKSRAIILQGD